MKKTCKILLVLCTIVLLTGAALGYPGYSTNPDNSTTNATKNQSTDVNKSVDKNATVNVTTGVTSTTGVPTVTITTVDSTTVKPTDTKPITLETPKESPGFGVVIAIGILSVVYIFGKRR